jgi:hypothetical protein
MSPEDFAALWSEAETAVRILLASELRTHPEADLEEAMQETRIYAFQRLGIFDPRYPFSVFACGLARNVAKRHRRPGRPMLELSLVDPSEIALSPPTGIDPTFLELLEIFFRWGGYPHQQIAFGCGILLWGRAKVAVVGAERPKSAVTAAPERVVNECGAVPLDHSAASFLEELAAEMRMDREMMQTLSFPMMKNLCRYGSDLFRSDPSYRGVFHEQDMRVGDTPMSCYFGATPTRSVSDWIRAVRKRIERIFFGRSDRCSDVLEASEEWR